MPSSGRWNQDLWSRSATKTKRGAGSFQGVTTFRGVTAFRGTLQRRSTPPASIQAAGICTRPERRRGQTFAALFGFFILLTFLAAAAQAATLRVRLDATMVASLDGQQHIYLEALPLKGEGLWAFSRRLTGGTDTVRLISRLNGKPRRLLAGVRYRVPYAQLTEDLQQQVTNALFPNDRTISKGREHTVLHPPHTPSLWRVAEWFTGDGKNFSRIRDANALVDDGLRGGETLIIPADLLLPSFRAELPALDYVVVNDNDYAVYHLQRGEALYSAVVMRFTGAIFAEDVHKLAAELASLNGIDDVTDIPVGKAIQVPFDMLLPDYLPADNPRRVTYEQEKSARQQYSNTVRASRLEGITVLLDAGHGGNDPGVSPGGVWESVYVYDIMVRVKELLENNTSAKVFPTTRDGQSFRVIDRDQLPKSRNHAVLTDPAYPIVDAKVGANLRWYLANSQHRKAVARSSDPAKTVFLSIHADSLPSSHRGMMAYIPAASLTKGEYGKSGGEYSRRKEVKEKPRVSFTYKERTRSEGLSLQLANRLLNSFKHKGLRIHHHKPIRDRVIRCRRCRPWVPAVVRYNAVPAKLLLEVCNLNNSEDRRLLQTRAFRQQVAEAIVDGLLAYYGQDSLDDEPTGSVAAP